MGVIYVARSANFSKWASEVGITKHVFKIGYAAGARRLRLLRRK